MVAPAIIGAGISAGASLLGGLFGDSSAKKAAARAARQNIEQLKNQHQWEVQDLRKAGLNPILSGTGGGGAGTISTPVAQVGAGGRGIAEAGKAASTAMELKLMEAQAENLDSQTRKNNQDYTFDRYFRPLERMQSLTTGRQGIEQSKANVENIRQGLKNLDEDLRGKKISNDQAQLHLQELVDNPQLRQFWMSAPYAERKKIDDALSGRLGAGEVIKVILEVLRGR